MTRKSGKKKAQKKEQDKQAKRKKDSHQWQVGPGTESTKKRVKSQSSVKRGGREKKRKRF